MRPYYQDASVTLYHGDSREILPALDPVDHLITDSPYSEHVHAKQWIAHALSDGDKRDATAHAGLGFDAITEDLAAIVVAAKVARWRIFFADLDFGIAFWRKHIEAAGLDYIRACVWDKVDSAPQFTGDRPAAGAEVFVVGHSPGKKRWNGGGRRNVFRHAVNGERGAKPHPSTKPLPLMLEIVQLFTDESETILDPFAGSGTTLVAAKDLGRRAIGIEYQEQWCEVIARRLAQESLFTPRAPAAIQAPLFDAPKVKRVKR